jgi:mono/diheme cytochrome c family protein
MLRAPTIALLPLFIIWASLWCAPARCAQPSFGAVERGRYLAIAGDCQACHTVQGKSSFAGGRPIPTPFGTIYSANITPDRKSGIGDWSNDQFYRALHEGISANGENLYPAFPYPWYTKITREDSDAIKAYLDTLDPDKSTPPPNNLDWPLNYRVVLKGWNELFFKEGTFRPNANKSPEWNRGAYLVEGLGHCGACHTPTNFLGATKTDSRLQGGTLQDWYAPNLAGDLRSGLGAWSAEDITTFLKTGRNGRSAAYGPMSEVITYSTSKLNDTDLKAMATYLKDMPADQSEAKAPKVDSKTLDVGKAIYVDNCSACHRSNGEGLPGMFPPLKGDATVQDREPTTIIRLILNGVHAVATDSKPTQLSMPAFDWKLSDDQIAALATYIRSSWGNSASAVSSSDVKSMRQSVRNTSN